MTVLECLLFAGNIFCQNNCSVYVRVLYVRVSLRYFALINVLRLSRINFLYFCVCCKVNSILVEPPSMNGNDESATDGNVAGSVTERKDRSVFELEASDLRQRNTFEKTRSKIERSLHVQNPLVRAVSQLGQEMLAGIHIIDIDSPR